jgi:hypothetical protein
MRYGLGQSRKLRGFCPCRRRVQRVRKWLVVEMKPVLRLGSTVEYRSTRSSSSVPFGRQTMDVILSGYSMTFESFVEMLNSRSHHSTHELLGGSREGETSYILENPGGKCARLRIDYCNRPLRCLIAMMANWLNFWE